MRKVVSFFPAIILLLLFAIVVIESCDRLSFRHDINDILTRSVMESSSDTLSKDTLLVHPMSIINYSSEDILKAYEKSNGLLSSNGLTYIVTLIVALLAALLLYRINEVEVLIHKNEKLEENVLSYYSHATALNALLTRFESVYDLTMIISSLEIVDSSLSEESADKKEMVHKKIGTICSRISILLEKVDLEYLDFLIRIHSLDDAEREILETYLNDSKEELNRISSGLKNRGVIIHSVVDLLIVRIEDIDEKLDRIP